MKSVDFGYVMASMEWFLLEVSASTSQNEDEQ
jgi:hypothetical protein